MKKSLLLALCIALATMLSLGGTLAYLQDSDSDVNVMTLGNVDIEQLEYERVDVNGKDNTEIKVFDENAEMNPLYPVVVDKDFTFDSPSSKIQWIPTDDWAFTGVENSESAIWDPAKINNEVDKFVFVKNRGKSPAYIRTWFAFELGELTIEQWEDLVHLNVNKEHWSWDSVKFTKAEIKAKDGTTKNYAVGVVYYTDNGGVLEAGKYSYPSLLQVALDKTAGNEIIASFGESYEILVISQAIQTSGFDTAVAALMEGFENTDPWEGGVTETLPWDGTADTSWYNETDTEFMIMNAQQLAGFAELVDEGNTFEGKTVKVGQDIDLYAEGDGDPITFNSIGDSDHSFKGTFDGLGHTITNMYQSGWALGYEWGKYGSIGLFSNLDGATVKNLNITNAESYVEGGDVGGIAGSATGTCVFENITISNSDFATYNNGNGGIIGWSGPGNYSFKNITITDDVTLTGLWGSFDSSIGGVVGQGEPGATYNFENVDIACVMNVFNDCTASYDYYNYRMCGMIIGRLEETTTIDGHKYPDTSKYNITCNDVTVTYDDWANYHYCDPTPGYNNGRGMRVESGYSYDGLPADYDHTQCTTHCKELIPFDQLFGGAQYGVDGLTSHDGVTVIYNNK